MQDVVDDAAPCFLTKGSPSGDAGQPDLHKAVRAFWSTTETEAGTEHRVSHTLLDVQEKPSTIDPFTPEKFLKARKGDRLCRHWAKSVTDHQSLIKCDRHEILLRKSKLEGALQRVVLKRIRHQLLHQAYSSVLSGHPGGAQRYYFLRREYYLPGMVTDVLATT